MTTMFHATAQRLVGTTVLLLLLTSPAAAQPASGVAFEAAHASYERNHWPEAFTGFAALADLGDAEAARIALQMVRRGLALYGTTFTADADRLTLWTRLAACISSAGSTACSAAQR